MAKQEWMPIEFANVPGGMSTNPIYPGNKFARKILNLRNNEKTGSLKLRPGYAIKFAEPSDPTITINDSEFPNFETFVDRQADADGQEIFCSIQKGEIEALTVYAGPITDETQKMLCFWCRPYWDGSTWVDEWKWINKTIITKIAVGSDATYPNMIKIYGGLGNGLVDNYLDKFTIYNKTKNEYAQIITSKNDGDYTRICHTLYSSSWSAEDVVVIGKNWIDLDSQEELFNVTREEIAFHKILNYLKIGFGGKENRPGLTVGYQKKYIQLREFDFPNLHPDLLESGVIENFSKIDELTLDTNILNLNYGLILNKLSTGNLPAGSYSIRLTGIINTFEEQLLAESQITIDTNNSIEILPYMIAALGNRNITGVGIYASTDAITYYKVAKYNLKENTYAAGEWKVDVLGRIILIGSTESEAEGTFELHTEDNAASAGDTNSVGSWITVNDGTVIPSTTAHDNYSLFYSRDILGSIDSSLRAGIIFPLIAKKEQTYSISAYLKSTNGKLYALFLGSSLKPLNRTQTEIVVTNEFVKYDFEVYADDISETPIYFAIALNPTYNLFGCNASGQFYKSYNGINWTLITTGLLSELYFILNLGSSILVAHNGPAYSGIYRSTDGGNNFTPISGTTGVVTLAKLGNKIYGGGNSGEIYRSDDNGISFTKVNDSSISNFIIDFEIIGSYLFAATFLAEGVFRSNDEGVTWVAKNTGLTDLNINSLCVKDTYLFASTETNKVFRSDDNGDSWTAKSSGIGSNFTASIVKKDTYLFVSTHDAGIFRSDDDGDSWVAVNTGITDLDLNDICVVGGSVFVSSYGGKIFKSDDNGGTWTEVANTTTKVFFAAGSLNEFYADLISIKEKSNSLYNLANSSAAEMSDEMGYTPTYNMVKGWDQAIAFKGRTYFLNPFVEKRYDNFLLVSHIEGVATYLWDLASFDNFRELEKFEGNETIGIALLRTMEILVLKDNSLMAIDPETGAAREPIYGVSCVSRNTIQNINGVILWCGIEDIYMIFGNDTIPKPLLKETIRDLYQEIENKNLIFATRDEKNSYRIRIFDEINKTEYLLTENGWIEEEKNLLAEVYRQGINNKLYFLSSGIIYQIGSEYTKDASTKITIDFRSMEFNIDEKLNMDSRYILGYLTASYITDANAELYIKIYFQRTNSLIWEETNPYRINNLVKKLFTKAPNGLSIINFYLRLYGTADTFELKELGQSIKELPLGKHALLNVSLQSPVFAIEIPLVGDLQANSATVVWATTHKSTGRVIYGLSPESMTSVVYTTSVFQLNHSLELPNLEMETRYYCRIYATSEITGQEIYSEVLSFLTSKETDVENILNNPIATFTNKTRKELSVMNQFGETEELLSTDPDADEVAVSNDVVLTKHVKVQLVVANIIGSEFTTSVTP